MSTTRLYIHDAESIEIDKTEKLRDAYSKVIRVIHSDSSIFDLVILSDRKLDDDTSAKESTAEVR